MLMGYPLAYWGMGAAALAVVVIALLLRAASHRSADQLAAARLEMQNSLTAQGQTVAAQINHLLQTVTTQLGQVRHELQTGIADSGKLAVDAQRDVSRQLQSATEAVRQISQQLGAVQKAGDDLSRTSQTIQQVLGGAKTRGNLGEIALERLLEDALPRTAFEVQHRFDSGEIVDAVVHSGDRMVPIDSKFPLDAYRKLIAEMESPAVGGLPAGSPDSARREFAAAVRKHVDAIAAKYIRPAEHTLDIALVFVPSEAIYYELLMSEDSKGPLDAYCRAKCVIPVSPNTLYAYLSAILMGLRGMQIEENARRLLGSLGGLQRQLDSLAEIYDKLGKHLHNAQQTYDDARPGLDRARSSIAQLSSGLPAEAGSLPDGSAPGLEAPDALPALAAGGDARKS